jgi:hypothetical protein
MQVSTTKPSHTNLHEPDVEPTNGRALKHYPSTVASGPDYSAEEQSDSEPLYGHPLMCASAPTERFPRRSVPARVAHQLIKDELSLDGNPKMNVRLVPPVRPIVRPLV